MKEIMRTVFVLQILAVFLAAFVLIPCIGEAVSKELVIGCVASLSGPGSEAYSNINKGVKLGVDWLNEKGGVTIKGEKYLLKMKDADAQGTVEGTVAAANKLIFSDKVKFLIGAMPPPPFVVAYTKVVEDNKVFRMLQTALGISTEFNPKQPYTFGTFPPSLGHNVGYKVLTEMYPKAKKIAIVCPEEPAALEDKERLKKLAAAHGLTVVAEETHPFGAVDFYPMWTKILAAKPDVVVNSATIPQWAGSILKQGRELGWKGVFLCPNANVDPYPIRDIAGSFATDVINIGYDLKSSANMTPEMKELAARVKKAFNTELLMDHVNGVMTIWLLAQAIENAQSLDPTVVRDKFDQMKNVKTVCGVGKVGGKKTFGVDHVAVQPVQIIRIMDGKVQVVKWATPVE